MTTAKLIETILNAPPERHAAIMRAATAEPSRARMGTVKDAAAVLGVHTRTVKRYARRGLLTERRLSKRMIRYDLAQVESLLSGNVGGGA
jgi:hypothetical protein